MTNKEGRHKWNLGRMKVGQQTDALDDTEEQAVSDPSKGVGRTARRVRHVICHLGSATV